MKVGAVSCPLFSFRTGAKKMAVETLVERLQGVVRPILDSLGFELVDLEYAGHGPRGILRVFIEKEGGITLEDCAQASRFLSHALDVEDPIAHSYLLEVSSPGLDRPLKGLEDFDRYQGRLVKIKVATSIEKANLFVGRLMGREEERIRITLKGEKTLEIPFQMILQARLEVEF
jgi:ribosome maturation factor RimP